MGQKSMEYKEAGQLGTAFLPLRFSDCKFMLILQKYIKFVFGLIEAFLQAHGVSQEEFVEACRKGLENGGKGAIVFREIMKADDFLYFQSKMILMWGHMQAREKGTEPPTPRGVCPDANAAKNMKR
uniref:BART domain-containing protein n=1 Tax=Palpitomonas bilix TaxID=652834 RepID=A0A7S3CXY6_9EUKA|mmetsp:Transcript_11447/g.30321  ORF Transcript_11447/g.30321 Transcript_11447/m.30321 type:complete len:126 (+) Transcript_11447:486-863(+)